MLPEVVLALSSPLAIRQSLAVLLIDKRAEDWHDSFGERNSTIRRHYLLSNV